MKQIIDKQKTTIDFLQNKSQPTNSTAAETIKKLNDNLKTKTKDLVEAKTKNKELAEELAELQNKVNGKDDKSADTDKCVKLTKVVSNKSKEITELKNENKALKEKSEEYLKKMNDASSKATAFEIKNTRLENQVENLIEAVGKRDANKECTESVEPQSRNVPESQVMQTTVKCRHNDKAICNRKETCQYTHSKLVCSSYSKFAQCENEQICPRRHPTGACNRWKKGVCNKDLECFYRHPEGEEATESRKRMLSGDQTPQTSKSQKMTEEDHFLFQKMIEREKKAQSLEGTRSEKKEEIVPAGWMHPGWAAVANQVPPFQPQALQHIPPFQPQGMGQMPAFQPSSRPSTPSGSQWIGQIPHQVSFHPSVHPYHV